MSPPPPSQVSVRYYLRRAGGAPSGPHDSTTIAAMLADGTLDGSEEVSADRKTWKSVRAWSSEGAGAPRKGFALAELKPRAPASAPRGAPLDFNDEDGISLAPLELGFAKDDDQSPGGGIAIGKADAKAEPRARSSLRGDDDSSGGDEGLAIGPEGMDLGAPLELVERKPPRGGKPAPPPSPAGGTPATVTEPHPPPAGGSVSGAPVASEASAAVASLMDEEGHEPPPEATQPVQLDEKPPGAEARARPRTMTAARGGPALPGGWRARRPSRRTLLIATPLVLLGAAGAAVLLLDLPGRLRGEISPVAVLGPLAAEIARDRFPAYSEAARRLDEAVAGQRGGASARAAAAELLASSVVIHGAERGRIARAQVLLDADEAGAHSGPAAVGRARAQAWIALAKGRWKDATRIAADPAIAAADRAALAGWAALGLEDAGRAATSFTAAATAQPPPSPSRVAALYGAAHAREAQLSPAAESEAAYRAVLAEAPAHVGAALGLVRLSKSSPSNRLALAEVLIAKQAPDASRAELAEAHALVARAARELGDGPKAEAALKRAREADPAGVAAAVATGDALLAEGRTDEAASQFKAALSPAVSAPRTPSLQFARVAALLESARPAEALAALGALERGLPGDARVPFWRGWAAERERPANPASAENAYREALARDPRFLPASLQLARLLLDQRRGADALGVLRNAETRGVPLAPLRIALGQAQLASRNADEAARTFRQLLATDAKNPAARLGLASALELQGNLEGARAELATLGARKDVPGLGSRVAAILAKLGRRDEALAAYQREITSGAASAATKVAAARVAIDVGRKDVARALAQAAVDDDPRTPGALLVLADVWRLDGDLPRAILELRRALAVDGAAEVQLEYGRALSAIGRDEEALAALAQARDIPESGVERGRILLRRGDAEGAVKDLVAATGRLPAHAEAHLLLGQAEDRLGHAARAEAAWRTAVKLAPASAESRYRLGRLEMDRGHAAAALPHLRVAGQHLPTVGRGVGPAWTTDLFFQLGFAETRHGSRERALTAFRRYLELAPADAPARDEVTRQLQSRGP